MGWSGKVFIAVAVAVAILLILRGVASNSC